MTGTDLLPRTRQRADPSQAASAVGDSMIVAAWTMVSRVTGLLRFAVIGAVLGPTFFGNTYQFTNSLPNLVYYGFLAGSLFPSLLMPALVRHIDAGDRRASERVVGGFLGVATAGLLLVLPLAVFFGPLALRIAAIGTSHSMGAAQEHVGRLLILMFIPQAFCYAVIGTATAVMNARKRFALAAGAPAIENVGTIAVLVATAVLYRTSHSLTNVPTGELLLLGLGSTGAVALHAATQWWGAKRAGVVILPRPGWRDDEVRIVARRAIPALGQAGLVALQSLTLLTVANRVPGGVVAFQIALSFYALADSLATQPVALSLAPRLARMHLDDDNTAFRDTLVRGLALGFFLAIPAAAGYLVLAMPLAHAMSFGRMDSAAGVTMIAAALVPLSLAIVAQTAFLIVTFASYARKDTRSPLWSMALQAVVCLGVVSFFPLFHGPAVLFILGLAMSVSAVAAACHLTARLWRRLGPRGSERLIPSLARIVTGAAVMAAPAWVTDSAVTNWLGRPFGPKAGIVAGALVGVAVYVAVEAVLRAPEVNWFIGGLAHMGAKARQAVAKPRVVGEGVPGFAARIPIGRWDRRLLRPVSGRWLTGPTILMAAVIGVVSALKPALAVAGLLALALMGCVWKWPQLAAYLAIGLTPFTVSLNVGHALPLIRPNEAIDVIFGAALTARGLTLARSGQLPHIRLNRAELAVILMAVSNSVIPLLWNTLRQQPISQDDLLYALVLWKLLGLYVLVRCSVSTDAQIRRCLWISVTVACVVAVVAVLQSLDLGGISGLLAKFYGDQTASGPPGGRATSLLGLTFATADLMIINLAVISGLWVCYRRHRIILTAAAALMVFGVISSGEFSAAIGLAVAVVCIGIVSGSPRLVGLFAAAIAVGAIVLWPVISQRLLGFQSASSLPASWLGRLQNLRTYFWPTLFSDWNWVLGVRPAARIPNPSRAGGYVWIESGYTWLLWGGGIPLLASYAFFTVVTAREAWQAARAGRDARAVAGIAVFTMVIAMVVLMVLGPDLTYRGSGDDFFFLIALATSRKRLSEPVPIAPRLSPRIRPVTMEVRT